MWSWLRKALKGGGDGEPPVSKAALGVLGWSREVRKLAPEKPRGRGLGLEGRDLARAV